jgi:hypothetical protein
LVYQNAVIPHPSTGWGLQGTIDDYICDQFLPEATQKTDV